MGGRQTLMREIQFNTIVASVREMCIRGCTLADPRVLDGITPRTPGPTLKSSIGMGGYNAAVVIDQHET